MDDFDFEENLKRLRGPLLNAGGIRTVEMYLDLLDELVRADHADVDMPTYWSVWRPSLESENRLGGKIDLLLSTIRDDALQLARAGKEGVTATTQLLIPRGSIHERLGHFILASAPSEGSELIKRELLRQQLWRRPYFSPEFGDLAAGNWQLLTADELQTVLHWIDQGPEDDLPQEDSEFNRSWRYRRLSALSGAGVLFPSEEYDNLRAEFGEIPRPQDSPVSASFVGPVSPISSAALREQGATAIVSRLNTWRPEPGWGQPTPEGLGRELSGAVGSEPELLPQLEPHVSTLHPTYVRAILHGARDAAQGGTPIDWPTALRVAAAAAAAERPVTRLSSDPFEADQDWGGARRAAAWVVLSALERDVVQEQDASLTWATISRLLTDPEPDFAHERDYGAANMDWPTLAINTTRPLGVLAAIRFVDVARRVFGQPLVNTSLTALDRHLDRAADASLSVAAVFGQMYPLLLRSVPTWTSARREQIFPPGPSDTERWWAAWSAYITFNRPTPDVIEDLHEEYTAAVLRSRVKPEWRFASEPNGRLAEHIVVAIVQGWLGTDSSLVALASEETRPEIWVPALSFAGRAAVNEGLTGEQLARLRRLWEHRAALASTGRATDAEFGGFGWWFKAPSIGDEWLLRQLRWVLERTNLDRISEWGVMERLAALAREYPGDALECAALLIDRPSDAWRVQSWRTELRALLEATASFGDPVVVSLRKEVASRLAMRWGLLEFRDVAQSDGVGGD